MKKIKRIKPKQLPSLTHKIKGSNYEKYRFNSVPKSYVSRPLKENFHASARAVRMIE